MGIRLYFEYEGGKYSTKLEESFYWENVSEIEGRTIDWSNYLEVYDDATIRMLVDCEIDTWYVV